METPTTYLISVKVRDENGKIIEDKQGIKFPSVNFEKTVHNYKQLEFQMRSLHRTFKALLPKCSIDIEAGVNNEIGGTIMNMASFYGSEKRFVKH